MKPTNNPSEQIAVYIFGTVAILFIFIVVGVVAATVAAVALIVWAIRKYFFAPPPPAPLENLYADTLRQISAVPTEDDVVENVLLKLLDKHQTNSPAAPVWTAITAAAGDLFGAEGFGQVPVPPPYPDDVDRARYRDQTIGAVKKSAAVPIFEETLSLSFEALISRLPPIAKGLALTELETATASFEVTLGDLLLDKSIITEMVLPYYREAGRDVGLFQQVRDTLDRNIHALSDEPFTPETRNTGDLIMPTDFKGTFAEACKAYLTGTPFERIFQARVPFAFPQKARFEHHWIVAGSGHGKTQLLQHLILSDLQSAEQPALIIIDSQGEMLRKIERMALFKDSDRLVVIDPEDDHPPALNLFDMSTARLQGYSRLVREQVEAGIVELYNYVFGALAADLTSKQGTAFAFVTRLMLSIPGATIHTLRELMEENTKSLTHSRFADAIAALDPTARAFFENQFYNNTAFTQTRQQLARRLYGVVQVPAFDRMLSAPKSKIDMFEAMQNGKVVLVNTSKSLLKTEASALFGRFMIAQALRAAYERVAVPDHERRAAYLIIDEASEYFDDSLETLLNQARKFNLGVVFAHQYLDQLDQQLRASVAANTSIKMAGGVSDRDARSLAADMRTNADFLTAQRKDNAKAPQWSEFACYIRNHTPSAVSLRVPFFSLENSAKVSDAELEALKARNRMRYASHPDESRPVATVPATPPSGAAEPDDWRS